MNDATQRFEWRARMAYWLAPRIREPSDVEQFLDLFGAGLDAAQQEGIEDAQYVVRNVLAGAQDEKHKHALSAIDRALTELIRRNKEIPSK